MASIWDGIETAEVFGAGNYFEPGLFDVKVARCQVRDGERGLCFIAEFEVLTSTNDKNKPGSTASWVQSMKDTVRKRMAFSSIKEFVLAIYGIDPKDKEKSAQVDSMLATILDRATSEENMLAGRIIHLETFHKLTKEKKQNFTVHRWAPAAT